MSRSMRVSQSKYCKFNVNMARWQLGCSSLITVLKRFLEPVIGPEIAKFYFVSLAYQCSTSSMDLSALGQCQSQFLLQGCGEFISNKSVIILTMP